MTDGEDIIAIAAEQGAVGGAALKPLLAPASLTLETTYRCCSQARACSGAPQWPGGERGLLPGQHAPRVVAQHALKRGVAQAEPAYPPQRGQHVGTLN